MEAEATEDNPIGPFLTSRRGTRPQPWRPEKRLRPPSAASFLLEGPTCGGSGIAARTNFVLIGQMENTPAIALVVAVAENGVIGRDNGLPWRLSTDLKRFKAITMGKPVLMGRKTFQSIGKPLPGRPNIVITRNQGFSPDGVTVVGSLAAAIEAGRKEADASNADEICIIGGGEIFHEALPLADRLYVTEVRGSPEGDTFLPPIDAGAFEIVSAEDVPAGEKDSHPTRFAIYSRRKSRKSV